MRRFRDERAQLELAADLQKFFRTFLRTVAHRVRVNAIINALSRR
jgi:hypothetical protein